MGLAVKADSPVLDGIGFEILHRLGEVTDRIEVRHKKWIRSSTCQLITEHRHHGHHEKNTHEGQHKRDQHHNGQHHTQPNALKPTCTPTRPRLGSRYLHGSRATNATRCRELRRDGQNHHHCETSPKTTSCVCVWRKDAFASQSQGPSCER